MTTDGNTQGETARTKGLRPPGLGWCFLGVGLLLVLLVGLSVLLGRVDPKLLKESLVIQGVAAVVAAGIAALLWEIRRWLMRTVTSLPFSTAHLGFLLVLTILGTVILQQAGPEAYLQRHGQLLGGVILALGLDDLFHTSWFIAFLGVIPISLVLTVIERKAWRLPMWGHLLSHLGFVVILIGGWYGGQNGFKGIIDLHEGEEVKTASVLLKDGTRGAARPLGFSLKLEKFAVENYVREAKFYVYQKDGDGYRGVRAFDLKEAARTRTIGSAGSTFRVLKAYPEFYLKPEVKEVPAGQGGPVLLVDFKQGDWTSRAALAAGVTGRDATELSAEGPPARFLWATPTAEAEAAFAAGTQDSHIITLQGNAVGEPAEEAAVTLNQSTVLPKGGYEVKLLEYLPDFTYDSKAKKATTRSPLPNNPAAQILITNQATKEQTTRWLFANKPEFGHDGATTKGPRFVYRHVPGHRPAAKEVLFLGESKQVWILQRGVVTQRLPLDQWKTLFADLPVVGIQVFPSAVVEAVPTTRSQAWENPVADIVLEEKGASKEIRLAAQHGQPVALADGKSYLSFELRADEPKAFRSHLTVLEDGKKITEKTIVVNDPLAYNGYMFYQSNFRKDDPTYSGIQVIRDPGLVIVFIGSVMMALGVIFIYYIRPRLLPGESHGH